MSEFEEEIYDCDRCHGKGEIEYGDDAQRHWASCPDCDGTGEVY